MIEKPTDIFGLISTSPAINQASSFAYPPVTAEIEGQKRSSVKDTGADEYSTQHVIVHPLHPSDVGPNSK